MDGHVSVQVNMFFGMTWIVHKRLFKYHFDLMLTWIKKKTNFRLCMLKYKSCPAYNDNNTQYHVLIMDNSSRCLALLLYLNRYYKSLKLAKREGQFEHACQ